METRAVPGFVVENGKTGEAVGLTRQLGLSSATAIVIGQVIAVGIFLAPATMARALGSPWKVFAIWAVMGVMAGAGALCYAELVARFPRAGGPYVYLKEAFGPGLGFAYGWMSLFVVDPGITAALALALAEYVARLTPLSSANMKIVGLAAICLFAAANMRGVGIGAAAVRLLTLAKLGLIAAIILLAFAIGDGRWSHFTTGPAASSGGWIAALAGAVVVAFFAYGGWWDVSKLAGEVVAPAKTLPRALLLGIGTVTLAYLLLTVAFIYVTPADRKLSDSSFAADVGSRLFGPAGEAVFAAVVAVSILGSLAGVIMAAPRVYYAMGKEGVFMRSIGRLDPRYGTPARAVTLQAALACVMVVWSNFAQIVAYFIFVAVLFLGLSVAALFIFRRRSSTPAPAYLVPGYPVTPIFFLLLLAVLLVLLFLDNPVRALAGLGTVALAWPVYRFLSRRKTPLEQTQL